MSRDAMKRPRGAAARVGGQGQPPVALLDRLDGGNEGGGEDADDGDHDQQLDEGETLTAAGKHRGRGVSEGMNSLRTTTPD